MSTYEAPAAALQTFSLEPAPLSTQVSKKKKKSFSSESSPVRVQGCFWPRGRRCAPSRLSSRILGLLGSTRPYPASQPLTWLALPSNASSSTASCLRFTSRSSRCDLQYFCYCCCCSGRSHWVKHSRRVTRQLLTIVRRSRAARLAASSRCLRARQA
jgi:hypothetical protein